MAGMPTSTNADRIPTLSDVVNGRHADFDICRRNAHFVRPFSLVGVWWENISRRRLFTGKSRVAAKGQSIVALIAQEVSLNKIQRPTGFC